MLILNYKRMKNDFLKFSSRKLFFSAMLVTALSAGASLPAFAGTAGVQSVMQAGTVKGLVVDATGESVIGASVLEKGTCFFSECCCSHLLYRLQNSGNSGFRHKSFSEDCNA